MQFSEQLHLSCYIFTDNKHQDRFVITLIQYISGCFNNYVKLEISSGCFFLVLRHQIFISSEGYGFHVFFTKIRLILVFLITHIYTLTL